MILGRIGVAAFGSLILVLVSGPTHAGFSGDPYIDATLGSAYTVRAGGSSSGIDHGGNVWKCGSSGAPLGESNCPNSASFSPAAATGGSQSWGVGVARLYNEDYEVECSLVVEFNPFNPSDIGFSIECELVPVLVPDGTIGRAMTILKWGSDNSLTQAFGNQPTSLLAYHENLLDACTPNVAAAQFGLDAACILNFNHSYVPDNGYESDIRITDPTCDIPLFSLQAGRRSHTPQDDEYNCFTYHQYPQLSNLPGYYRDTTLLDEEDELNIGFGSSEGYALQANTIYVTSQIFASRAQPTMLGTSARHEGAITTNVATVLVFTACEITGGLGCYYFTVKDAEVGGAADYFEPVIP